MCVCVCVYLRIHVLCACVSMHVYTMHVCVSMYVLRTYVYLRMYVGMYVLYTYVFMYGCVRTYEGDNFKKLDARILLKDKHILTHFGLITINSHGCYVN